MKKLTNVSPFLLLLVPVFIMMLLTFVKTGSNNQDEEMTVKASASKTEVIKVNNPFSK